MASRQRNVLAGGAHRITDPKERVLRIDTAIENRDTNPRASKVLGSEMKGLQTDVYDSVVHQGGSHPGIQFDPLYRFLLCEHAHLRGPDETCQGVSRIDRTGPVSEQRREAFLHWQQLRFDPGSKLSPCFFVVRALDPEVQDDWKSLACCVAAETGGEDGASFRDGLTLNPSEGVA